MLHYAHGFSTFDPSDPGAPARRDRDTAGLVREIMLDFLQQAPPPAFHTIEIETINRCNNDCAFCPVRRGTDPRPLHRMSTELLDRLLAQLAAMDFRGVVSLFSNNEPLLDPRMPDLVREAKRRLPHAKHVLYTNGTLLTGDVLADLARHLDFLIVDNYDDSMEVLPAVRGALEAFDATATDCEILIWIRRKNQVLHTRAGLAPNRAESGRYTSGCVLPFSQMVVRPDGTVSRCCQDAWGESSLGDASAQELLEIWHGKPFRDLREELASRGRGALPGCRVCDLFGTANYNPPRWHDVLRRHLVRRVRAVRAPSRRVLVFDTATSGRRVADLLIAHGTAPDGIIVPRGGQAPGATYRGLPFVSPEVARSDTEAPFIVFPGYEHDLLRKLSESGREPDRDYLIAPALPPYPFPVPQEPLTGRPVVAALKTLKSLVGKQLVVFGAGQAGGRVLRVLPLPVAYFVDNDEAKWGREVEGVPIEPPERLVRGDRRDTRILVASMYYEPIALQLSQMGFREGTDFLDALRAFDLSEGP